MSLAGRRILVAGATGELGRTLCAALQAEGAQIGALGRDRGRLDELAGAVDVAASGVFDARDPAGCGPAVDAVVAGLGGLDACIVAVGVPAFGDAGELPADVVELLFLVNAVAPIALLNAADGHLERGGALAAVTGVVAAQPTAGMAAYSAAKAALRAYLTALRRERRRRGVSVLEACLPHLDTAFADRALAGAAPALPAGLAVEDAADAILSALVDGRRELSWDSDQRALQAR